MEYKQEDQYKASHAIKRRSPANICIYHNRMYSRPIHYTETVGVLNVAEEVDEKHVIASELRIIGKAYHECKGLIISCNSNNALRYYPY